MTEGSFPPRDRARIPRTVTQTIQVVRDAIAAKYRHPDGRARKRIQYPLYALRIILQVIRQWARDHCPQQAASLAYQTTLSLVPLLAIALALLRMTGGLEAQSTLVNFLSEQVLPFSRNEIADHLVDWVGNITFQAVGMVGIITTLVVAFVMYASVERIFNDVWRAERRRSLGQKFVVFYALVTIVPGLLGISLYHAARYGLTSRALGVIGAFVASFFGLLLANKLLPTTRVSWRSAALGALVSAFAFEISKNLFRLYVAHIAFRKYYGVYGALGLIPIFLVWVYLSWLVILFGAEVAHATQNLRHLERHERGAEADDVALFSSGALAARIVCAIATEFRSGGRGVTTSALATRLHIKEEIVAHIGEKLKAQGLILEVEGDAEGFLPARSPSDITLADVLAPFSDVGLPQSSQAASDRLGQVLVEVDKFARDQSRRVTIAELTEPQD